MITTNDHVNAPAIEPKKLDIRTTDQLKQPAPEPVTRGAGPGKMITTHDERDIEDHSASNPLVNEGLPEPAPKKGGAKKST